MITIDGDRVVVVREGGAREEYDLGTPEAFHVLSKVWLRSGWINKHVYSFTWLGRPVIQLPEDMIRLQEIIYTLQPDVIVETGVAHGGSLIFHASVCQLVGRGRVIGVDIEIRPHNRRAIETHQLASLITLIEGSSVDPSIVKQITAQIKTGEQVLILLDSCHSRDHVLAELRAYSPLVTPSSYIVATDGIMEDLVGAPRSEPDWGWNNPRRAALEFVADNPQFIIEEPEFRFNEGNIRERVTHWPSAFIKRVRKPLVEDE